MVIYWYQTFQIVVQQYPNDPNIKKSLGVIHKPRGELRGEGG